MTPLRWLALAIVLGRLRWVHTLQHSPYRAALSDLPDREIGEIGRNRSRGIETAAVALLRD